MSNSRHTQMRSALATMTLVLTAILLTPGVAGAVEIQGEAAQPHIFGASLEAHLDPMGEESACEVQYTSSVAFAFEGWANADASPCSPGLLLAGDPAQRVTAELSGLAADAEYRYRFLATTAAEVIEGPGGSFHTFGVEAFTIQALDALGEPQSAAGSYPYELVTRITLPHGQVKGIDGAAALAKTVLAELPPGLIGNPTAVEQCPTRVAEEDRCSGDSQVGLLHLRSAGKAPNTFDSQIYNMTPAIGQAARLGGEVNLSTNAYIGAGVRTGEDYGINAGSFNLPTLSNPFEFEIRIWGVPASPAHDPQRVCGALKGCSVTAGMPVRPFLRNPTHCAGPPQARVKVDSYNLPGTFFTGSDAMPAIVGCEQLHFEPALEVQPASETADSPTGLHVELSVPQSESANQLATPDLRDAVVALPPGLTLNPSSATGLEGCSAAQFGLSTPIGSAPIHTTAAPAACPDAAKIGTVSIETPLLDRSVSGAVYVASPYENPFNSLLAIYVSAEDPVSGVVIKLAGRVELGAEGQLTTSFEENPQLPFETFELDFFGGPRAALKTPALCGTYTTTSTLTPYSAPASGPPATPSDSHQITTAPAGGSCPTSAAQMPNKPGFEAGTEAPLAGAFSPFVMQLRREDGSQRFASLSVTPPPGLLGKLAGVPPCSEAALAAAAAKSGTEERGAPSCPAASEIGVVNVGAGAGPAPYYVQGRAYLAGPYKGAPLSLAIITPALAGPYDLGAVLVRSSLEVDPSSAQITVKSDPIPSELKGIALDVRSIAVKLDRPGFTLNPTSCEAMQILGTATSPTGDSAALQNRFQVGGCAELGFKPALRLELKGATHRRAHPKLIATLKPRPGDANVSYARVKLPKAAFLDNAHIGNVCTRPAFAAETCPASSLIGKATARTPLLGYALPGKVYLVPSRHELPDVAVAFKGPPEQPLKFTLTGKTDSVKGALRNTFESTPDVPVSSFRLELFGAKRGLIELSAGLCKRLDAQVLLKGQNGKQYASSPKVKTSCPKRAAKGKRQRGPTQG